MRGIILYKNQAYTLSFRALVEKSPALETKTGEHESPRYPPAVAHRIAREGFAQLQRGAERKYEK